MHVPLIFFLLRTEVASLPASTQLIVTRVGPCLDHQSTEVVTVPEMSLRKSGGMTTLSGPLWFRHDVDNGWSIKATMQKCHDIRNLDTCDFYKSAAIVQDGCLVPDREYQTIFKEFMGYITPRLECPIKAGNYTLKNFPFYTGGMLITADSKISTSVFGYTYRIEGFNDDDNRIFCIESNLRMTYARNHDWIGKHQFKGNSPSTDESTETKTDSAESEDENVGETHQSGENNEDETEKSEETGKKVNNEQSDDHENDDENQDSEEPSKMMKKKKISDNHDGQIKVSRRTGKMVKKSEVTYDEQIKKRFKNGIKNKKLNVVSDSFKSIDKKTKKKKVSDNDDDDFYEPIDIYGIDNKIKKNEDDDKDGWTEVETGIDNSKNIKKKFKGHQRRSQAQYEDSDSNNDGDEAKGGKTIFIYDDGGKAHTDSETRKTKYDHTKHCNNSAKEHGRRATKEKPNAGAYFNQNETKDKTGKVNNKSIRTDDEKALNENEKNRNSDKNNGQGDDTENKQEDDNSETEDENTENVMDQKESQQKFFIPQNREAEIETEDHEDTEEVYHRQLQNQISGLTLETLLLGTSI